MKAIKIFGIVLILAIVVTTTALAATDLSSANFTATIGTAGRLYIYPAGSTSHQCRTNGAGDNPSADGLLAMYEVGGVPYVLATKGSTIRLYWGPEGLPGIKQCNSMPLPDPAIGTANCKYTAPGSYGIDLGDGITVEHDAKTNRVAFVQDCKSFLGRTNGHTDNGQLLAAWMDGGVPYALVLRPATNGRNPLIVITPRNNAGSVKLVDILNP